MMAPVSSLCGGRRRVQVLALALVACRTVSAFDAVFFSVLTPTQPRHAASSDLITQIEQRNRVASMAVLREWAKGGGDDEAAAPEAGAPITALSRLALFETEAARLLGEVGGPAAAPAPTDVAYELALVLRPIRVAWRFARWFAAAWPRPENKQRPLRARIIGADA